MTEGWFDRLEDDVRHAASVFHHHSPNIAGNQPQQPQEPAMALADTAATLKASHASALAELEDLLAKGHDVVDNHMTQIATAIGDVSAVASIADDPAMQAMEKALPVVPRAILEGITAMLNAVAAEHASRAQASVAPEGPAEPAPEQQAA